MARVTRRRLLQMGAGAGLTALAADPLVSAAMAKRKLPPADLTDIEHVVILIQENRSFDHYFGMLPGVRGFGDKTERRKASFRTAGGTPETARREAAPVPPRHHRKRAGKRCYRTSPTRGSDARSVGTGPERHLRGGPRRPTTELKPARSRCHTWNATDIPFYWALAENFTDL